MSPNSTARGLSSAWTSPHSRSHSTRPKGCPATRCTEDFDKIVQDAKLLDVSLLRIGMLPLGALRSVDAIVDFAKQANEYAEQLRPKESTCTTTITTWSSPSTGGRYLLDVIADNSPAMGLELDVHWVQRGGLDPSAPSTSTPAGPR